jgi:hypothetical protein
MFKPAKWTTLTAMAALVALGAGMGGATASAASRAPRAPVNLRSAGAFVILTKTGITNVPTSAIIGDIGTSPITGAAITGLGCPEVTGTIYTVDAAGPPCRVVSPSRLTTAINDMATAYTDAAGRVGPDATELGAGSIGGRTIGQGLYKWSSDVLIGSDVTLSGGPNAVWIFQIAGSLRESSGARVNMIGGAQAKNVFWQVAGAVILGTTANLKGVVLCKTRISPNTGATIYGRLFAQTAVTLKMNRVTQPHS